ncbi:SusC/RagA family TonB-linked outer membrane protein [Maribacter sp. 2210JD10-5]|uniref:SusC/RagA family TonB-linked outer membrane protein n=1 Tax=Maribacter sp. 2210JD10-5 TaxID=3386272 RepID=UPI0039BD658D
MKHYCDVFLRKYSIFGILLLFLNFSFVQAQTTVTGTVTDSSGAPLPGATVVVKGTSNGTQTDFDGNYSITAQEPDGILEFSYIGFAGQEIPIDGRSVIDIGLKEDVSQLDEVVLIGYGSVKKSDATGAMTSLKSEDLNKGAALSPQQLLQGKAAGVSITQNSGRPGSQATVRVRGPNSVNFSNDPLYVIDGVPVSFAQGSFGGGGNTGIDRSNREATNPLSLINPADIESIDILKDASATAIYGSRAANGVILITTKSGKDGVNRLNYETYIGASTIRRKLPVLTAEQVRQYAAENPGLDFEDRGANVDWQDEIFRTALTRSHSLSLTGGNKGTNYQASFGYQDQEGIIISSGVENITGRLNLNSKFLNDKLTVSANVLYAVETSDNVPTIGTAGGDGAGDVIRDALRATPTTPVRDPNSPYSGGFSFIQTFVQNPVEQALLIDDIGESKRLLSNISFDFELHKNLNFKTNLGYTQEHIEKKSFFPLSTRIGFDNNGFANFQTRNNNNQLIETTFDYHNDSNENHKIKFLAGYSWQEFSNSGSFIRRSGFVEDIIGFNGIDAGEIINNASTSAETNKIISFFGRANYDLFNKYLFTATLRYDGSTRFGADTKWGIFPSAAFAWKISEEEFLRESSTVSTLKLRVGYGVTGNQAIANFGSLALTNVGLNQNPELGLVSTPSTVANPNLKWESTAQLNLGLDYGFMNDRITGSFEVYKKRTTDLILRFLVPSPTPVETRLENVGEVENKGIEFNTNINLVARENFDLDFYGNISTNRNEVISLSEGNLITPESGILSFTAPSPQQQSQILITKEGESLGSLFGWEFIGFDQNGEERFRDLNNDGVINSDDRKIIGVAQPDFTYGFGINMNYKRWSFGAFLRGVQGIDLLNSSRNDLENISNLPQVNQLDAVLRSGATLAPSSQVSSRFVEDASFLRMENATLGYNLNVDNFPLLQSLNLYVTGQNLFVLTEYSGFDPELNVADFSTYPRARTYILGIKAQF